MEKITVTKVDAAERQLRVAIRLFFEDRDPVAVHTLASAAAQVTADLMKASGRTSIVRSAAIVREERRKEVRATMAAPEYFFKHADRDPAEAIEFNPETTEFFIYASLAELQVLAGKIPREGQVFQMWFLLKYDDMLLENDATRVIRQALAAARNGGVSAEDKGDFLPLLGT